MNDAQTQGIAVRANTAIYRFKIGEFDAVSVSDGQVAFPAYPTYAPNATKEAVEQSLRENFMPVDLYTLNINALFVHTSRNKVLFDTGAGQELGARLGRLATNLKIAGVEAEQIDTVVISHGHPDHIGGLVTGDGLLQFPNAQHFIAEAEWNFWTAEQLNFGGMQIDNDFKQVFVSAARTHLRPLTKSVTLFGPGRELVPGIHAIAAPGHTPGHCAILVSSGNAQLLNAADTFHNQAFDLDHPDWATAFDLDPAQAHATRLRLLDQASADRTLLMAYHMPFPGLGHVRIKNGRYDWVATPWLLNPYHKLT